MYYIDVNGMMKLLDKNKRNLGNNEKFNYMKNLFDNFGIQD